MTGKTRRRIIVVVVPALLLLGSVATAAIFWSNTESLTITEDAGPFRPGESLTIELSIDEGVECGPSFEHLYRRTLFGRWRLTHTSDDGRQWDRHDRGMLSLGSWSDSSQLPCPLQESAPLVVPSDITWSPIVACNHDAANCVVIDIDLKRDDNPES